MRAQRSICRKTDESHGVWEKLIGKCSGRIILSLGCRSCAVNVIGRRSLAVIAGGLGFCLAMSAFVAITIVLLGWLYACILPVGSCGDSIGWAMIISAPFTVPLALILAGVCAAVIYVLVMKTQILPTQDP